jgi:YD repeat-containing protein
VRQYSDGSGSQTNAKYDSNSNLTSVTAPTGASTTIGCSVVSHPDSPTSMADPQGNTTSYQYERGGERD